MKTPDAREGATGPPYSPIQMPFSPHPWYQGQGLVHRRFGIISPSSETGRKAELGISQVKVLFQTRSLADQMTLNKYLISLRLNSVHFPCGLSTFRGSRRVMGEGTGALGALP